jgi:hypothetical protein
VSVIAISTGKNNAKTGRSIVPSPKPENKVNPDPNKETMQMMK